LEKANGESIRELLASNEHEQSEISACKDEIFDFLHAKGEGFRELRTSVVIRFVQRSEAKGERFREGTGSGRTLNKPPKEPRYKAIQRKGENLQEQMTARGRVTELGALSTPF
jgi:hypothetical protein